MSKKHIHRYHRVDTSAGELWACSMPDCTHFMPAHYTELLPGRASICWECGENFILTKENMKRKQPICPDCEGISQLASVVSGGASPSSEDNDL